LPTTCIRRGIHPRRTSPRWDRRRPARLPPSRASLASRCAAYPRLASPCLALDAAAEAQVDGAAASPLSDERAAPEDALCLLERARAGRSLSTAALAGRGWRPGRRRRTVRPSSRGARSRPISPVAVPGRRARAPRHRPASSGALLAAGSVASSTPPPRACRR
jgi:hypothetical protein